MNKFILSLALVMSITATAQAMDKDRGGGNSYRGRPLESFIRSPKDLPAYQALQKIQNKFQQADLINHLIEDTLLNKAWYFVPGPLKQLPSNKIGSVVPTEQVALQNFTAIWIDQDIYVKMSLEDQGRLLLHEVLMGIKLLKFQSRYRQCMASMVSMSYTRVICRPQSKMNHGSPADLTSIEYNEIRQLGAELLNLPDDVSSTQIENLFNQRNFNFPMLGTLVEISGNALWPGQLIIDVLNANDLSNIPTSKLYRVLDILKKYPELKTGDAKQTITLVPKGKCELSRLTYANGFLTGTYRSINEEGVVREFPLKMEFNITSKYALYSPHFDINFLLGPESQDFIYLTSPMSPSMSDEQHVGDHILALTIFSGPNAYVQDVHFVENVVTVWSSPVGSHQGLTPVKNGLNEICSVREKIVLQP